MKEVKKVMQRKSKRTYSKKNREEEIKKITNAKVHTVCVTNLKDGTILTMWNIGQKKKKKWRPRRAVIKKNKMCQRKKNRDVKRAKRNRLV